MVCLDGWMVQVLHKDLATVHCKKDNFCNCNYEAATELCSTTTIRSATSATENYNAQLQCVLCKTTVTLHMVISVEQITICTVAIAIRQCIVVKLCCTNTIMIASYTGSYK